VQTLSEQVERELAEAGFPKVAYNPFTTADRDRPVIHHDGKDLPAEAASLGSSSNAAQNDFDKVRGRDHKTSPMFVSMPAMKQAMLRVARELPMKQILQGMVEKRSSELAGLKSRNEVYQTFTGSDLLNRIKLAGMSDRLLRMLPDEWALSLVRNLKGGRLGSYADELEAGVMGRGLRAAAEAGDIPAAQRLFEGAGGAPSIDPVDLAGLQLKARAADTFLKDPMEQYLSGMTTGIPLGIGAGFFAPRLLNQGEQR